jgi:hypothetical protein
MKTEFPEVFTPKEVGDITRTSEEAVINELNAGHMQGFKVGNEWRMTKER